MRLKIFICAVLGIITLQIFSPANHFNLVYYDDPAFVAAPQEMSGLSGQALAWVMTGAVVANWHPVTNFSFLFMHEVYGLNPGAEHSLNTFINACNAMLLFLVLWQLTGATWRSAFVAAIFAWHPLRVESVAWIAERKDELFMFFMLLSLLCYKWYAQGRPEKPAVKDPQLAFEFPPSRRVCYCLALLFFVLSFMSKAMVVTLPFLLLLLDFWPLQRLNRATVRRLLMEKIPFFALTVFFCVLTFWLQKKYTAVRSLEQIGMVTRLENATLSYVNYLGHFFWPSNLAVIYPYPQSFDVVQVLLAALLLLAISAFCVLQLPRRPYLAVGWFWYLGTMVPVIGLVQVGEAAMADRYTYLPLIGPAISLVWLVAEWAGTKFSKTLATAAAAILLVGCLVLTRKQLWYWQDSVALFGHEIAVMPGDAFAEFSLGKGFEMEGRLQEAAVHYRSAIALKPGDFESNLNLGALYLQQGYYHEAAARFESILKSNPDSPMALNNLAWMLATCPEARVQDHPRAVKLAERACELTHYQNATFVTTLAMAYGEAGRFDDGIAMTQKAIALAQLEGNADMAGKDERLLQLYEAHQPYQP